MTVCLSVCQHDFVNTTDWIFMKKIIRRLVLVQLTYLNFDSDLDQCLDTEKYQRSGFSDVLIIIYLV